MRATSRDWPSAWPRCPRRGRLAEQGGRLREQAERFAYPRLVPALSAVLEAEA